jgi:predicted nucleic acid-binding protein
VITFFDTSVLVAAFLQRHPNHATAVNWLSRARSGEFNWVVAAHSLAETYSTLSRLPKSDRQSPAIAAKLIDTNIAKGGASIVALTAEDYVTVVQRMAEANVSGGAMYDALIAFAAQKANVEKLLTYNVSHFKRVWPEAGERIQAP